MSDPVIVSISGVIGQDVTSSGVAKALEGASGRALEIHINSPGGGALESFSIYQQILAHQGIRRVVIGSLAASGAAIVAMAGTSIAIDPSGQIMVHRAHSRGGGDSEDHRAIAEELEGLDRHARAIFAGRTGLSVGAVDALMGAETWFSAESAKAHRFVDTILPAAPAQNSARKSAFVGFSAAGMDLLRHYRRTPPGILAGCGGAR